MGWQTVQCLAAPLTSIALDESTVFALTAAGTCKRHVPPPEAEEWRDETQSASDQQRAQQASRVGTSASWPLSKTGERRTEASRPEEKEQPAGEACPLVDATHEEDPVPLSRY